MVFPWFCNGFSALVGPIFLWIMYKWEPDRQKELSRKAADLVKHRCFGQSPVTLETVEPFGGFIENTYRHTDR